MNKKNRVAYWQYIRGLCIILVVLIHSKTGISYQEGIHSWNFNYWLLLRALINFPVAIFIFLSGYFYKYEDIELNTLEKVVQRIKQLIIPFFVWSIIYTSIKIIRGTGEIHLLKEAVKILLGMSSPQLYFILVLIQLTILSPFLVNIIKRYKYSGFLFFITPAYLIMIYIYIFLFGKQFLFYQTFFPAWMIFYYFGLWVKIKGYPKVFSSNIYGSIILCVFALLLSVLENTIIKDLGFPIGFATSQIKFSSFIYALTVINLIFTFKKVTDIESMELALMGYLGDNSYGIYYVHMIYIPITGFFISYYLSQIHNILPIF